MPIASKTVGEMHAISQPTPHHCNNSHADGDGLHKAPFAASSKTIKQVLSDGVLSRLSNVSHRNCGIFDQPMGNSVMGFQGAPIKTCKEHSHFSAMHGKKKQILSCHFLHVDRRAELSP